MKDVAQSKKELKKLTLEERIAKHRRMAEAYYGAYAKKAVKDGAAYEEWKFADNAEYWSPYFTGDHVMQLGKEPISVAAYATLEALAYSVKFPDWGPVDFKCWPSDIGWVMRTKFMGHMKNGKAMSFYAIGFVETNDQGLITSWQTFVDGEQYGDFLQAAIGQRGPYLNGHEPYFGALVKVIKDNGLSMEGLPV